jgi:hypothetical protein
LKTPERIKFYSNEKNKPTAGIFEGKRDQNPILAANLSKKTKLAKHAGASNIQHGNIPFQNNAS